MTTGNHDISMKGHSTMPRDILACFIVYSSISDGFLHTAAVHNGQERAEEENPAGRMDNTQGDNNIR